MDSLPKQHIEDLPGAGRQDAYDKVRLVFLNRLQKTNSTEDEIADRAGFGGADAMHQQLAAWGFVGLLPPQRVQPALESEPPETVAESKARGSGPVKDLPPAANATSIFQAAIEKLSIFVERLPTRKEHRQGKRFVVSYAKSIMEPVEPGEEEGYLEAPPDHDGDLDITGAQIYRRVAGGASRIPDNGLTAAIAAAILTGATTDELIDVLQDEPPEWHRKKARELVEGKDGLKNSAGRIAALMRGYPIGKGDRDNEASKEWQSAAWDVQRRRGYGYTEKDIVCWLNERDTLLPELKKSRKVTAKDVRDLLSLDLEPYDGFKDQLNREP